MTITLYKYTGEKEKVDKSGDLQTILTTTGQFKADTSLLAPSLILALPTQDEEFLTDENGNLIADVQISVGGKVLDFNYFYVAEFRRYYYVSSIIVSSQSLIVVTGEVDPLFSFKDEILENYAFIARNEFSYDIMVEDSILPLEARRYVTEYEPNAGSLVNTTFDGDINTTNFYNIVLTTITDYYSAHTILPPTDSDLPQFNSNAFIGGSCHYAIKAGTYDTLMKGLLGSNSSKGPFVKSAIAYPFNVDTSVMHLEYSVIFGEDKRPYDWDDYTIPGVKGIEINSMSPYLVVADFYMPVINSYLMFKPYSRYEIYIPFYGWYELDIDAVSGARIIVYYSTNYEDGSATVYVKDITNNKLIFSTGCQLGVQLAITQSNNEQITAQKNALNANLAIGLIASVLTTAGGIAKGSPITAAKGVLSGVSSVTDYINSNAMLFDKATASLASPAAGLYTNMKVRIRETKTKVLVTDMAKFAHDYGRPLNQSRQLKTLSGFTQISKIHLEGCTALDVEKRAIESSLLAGVIL